MLAPEPVVQRTGRPRPDGPRKRPLLLAAQVVLVRLRFLLVLAGALGVVASWDVLRNYWDKVTRPRGGDGAVSRDTEYWCPMCPGVVSEWPGKCPVCNMALQSRVKGSPVPLPDGVLARMQFSPYRIQLAGIHTAPVEYRTLLREVVMVGLAQRPESAGQKTGRVWVKAEVHERDLPFLAEGQEVEATSELFPGRAAFRGQVRKLGPYAAGTRAVQVLLEIDGPEGELRPGMLLTCRARAPAARQGWGERAFREAWRDRTTVELTAHALAGPLGPAGVESLLRAAGARAALERGMVPALPESAVVDTGSRKVVYVESGPGMFDGVEVTLGPRCGDHYPVLRGPAPGQRVATAGAFLIDAETQLNTSAAAAYFGAERGPAPAPAATALVPSTGPSAADKALIAAQKVCPVTGEPLDSMGGPVRVEVAGRVVFVCCKGCEPALRKDPAKYLGKLKK